jgi:dienelactone hydrolase/predicted Ser/Thr protein kinase
MEGRTVSHYRILKKLGEGGMGEVYQALDQRLDRTVAIKFSKEGFSRRFSREAKTIASLNHPHICSLYDVGDFEGAGFLVMEYVEGARLPSPLPVEMALDYAVQIADALEAAHQKGIIHRDLKPANILVTPSGQIKVLDFGIAKHAPVSAADGEETPTVTAPDEQTLTAKGVLVGTVAYMSPEQVEGKPVDVRSDIFSFGAVLYELLTGSRAFHGDSVISTMSAILREAPAKVSRLRKDISPELERIVERCLEKNRELRYSSSAELRRDLAACLARLRRWRTGFRALLKNPRVAIPAALVLLALVCGGVWFGIRARRVEWAETRALPEIVRLAEQADYAHAFNLATRAEKVVPGNKDLAKLWPEISITVSVQTEPPGAEVEMKTYNDVDGPWVHAGRTPVSNLRIAREYFRWRFSKSGFETLEYPGPQGRNFDMKLRLTRQHSPESGMVYVPQGTFRANLPGFGYLGPFPIDEHWMDKFEVTNRQFKQFVDAGGYGKREYWDHPFVKDRRTLTWEQGMAILVDATGRPGPSTWEAGTYPDGKDDFPVGGVSWFEAAAYAKFAGKSLPTLYHWYYSAQPLYSQFSMYLSNFGRAGPAPVGHHPGVAGPGVYDMGGNVREWCWNEAKGRRYSLGGAWDDPLYFNIWSELRDPFDRAPGNGFRCVKYAGGPRPPERFAAPIERPFRDYSAEKPVSDESFRIFRSIYAREPRPLNPVIISEDASAEHWRKLQVAYDAGYGAERMTAYLFLPKRAAPPYQAVLYFPGAGTILERSSKSLRHLPQLDFIIKSGRAVLYPIYKGTYERQAGVVIAEHNREQVNMWVSEVSRSLDYLESRPDIQRGTVAYYGWSWGAHMAPIFLSLEERFKTGVLIIGGLLFRPRTPESDEFNFAPRVKAPVLMVNARYDFIFPLETSVQPLFRLLGTSPKDKRLVVLEGGHGVFAKWSEVMRETLDWLDRYLGPVKR